PTRSVGYGFAPLPTLRFARNDGLCGLRWRSRQREPHGSFVVTASEPAWPDRLFAVLKAADVRQVGYVPDAGHARLIELGAADPAIRDVVLTTEEEGVALAAGAWLGGQRAALLLQSSGVGNCINMLSLIKSCRFPLVMLVTMRGEWAEFNPWQVAMGSIVEPTLRLADVHCYRIERPGEAADIAAGAGGPAVSRPHTGPPRPPPRVIAAQ